MRYSRGEYCVILQGSSGVYRVLSGLLGNRAAEQAKLIGNALAGLHWRSGQVLDVKGNKTE